MTTFLWKETATWRAFTDTTLQKYRVGKKNLLNIKTSNIPINGGHRDFQICAVTAFKR